MNQLLNLQNFHSFHGVPYMLEYRRGLNLCWRI